MLILALLPVIPLSSAGYNVDYITNRDGLSNSSVNVVFQDSRGLMWFGTWDGLNSWNGRNFNVFKSLQSDSTTISNNVIRQILEDGEGNLWIATDRGIDRYFPSSGRFQRFFVAEGSRAVQEKTFSIWWDGNVCAMVEGRGAYRFDGNSFKPYSGAVMRSRSHVSVGGFDPSEINDVFISPSDTLVATGRGLYRLGPEREKMLTDIPVLSVCRGTQGVIWAGTDMRGVVRIAPEQNRFDAVIGAFGGNAVRCFSEDALGRLYVGTKGGGIYVFDRYGALVRHLGTDSGLPNNSVFCMADGGDRIWLGTDGEGLCHIDKRTGRPGKVEVPGQLRSEGCNLSSIYSIAPIDSNTVWVGTSGHGLFRLSLSSGKVVSFVNYGAESLGSNVVYSILDTPQHVLWIGTRGGGLRSLRVSDGTIGTYPCGYDVLALSQDNSGNILVGTGMGLYRVSLNGQVMWIGQNDGLPNNTVHGVIPDSDGHVWVSTSNGLCKVSFDGGSIVSFFSSDGLQDNEFSDGAFYRSPSTGLMYFGGIGGFNRFDSRSIGGAQYMPPLIRDGFYIDNQERCFSDMLKDGTLVLEHERGTVGFRYVPMDYLNPFSCEISYMLEGYDRDWVRLGLSNNIVFTNLPPGRYTLRVRCSNSNGQWSDDAVVLPLKVSPKWYESGPAMLMYYMLFAFVVFLIVRFVVYRRSVKERILDEQRQKQQMTRVHEAKLQFFTNIAHEFSNSLTLIYGPCAELQQDKRLSPGEKHLLDVIESNSSRMQSLIQQLIMFRKAETGHLSVHITPVDVTQLADKEMDYFRETALQHGIAMGIRANPSSIVWNTDRDSIEKVMFNLLSNALKYTPDGCSINIGMDCNDALLEFSVTNTGVGIPEEKREAVFDRYEVLDRFEKAISKGRTSNGIGLSMCKSLVELLGGSIEIESDGESFTTFKVALPFRQAEEAPVQPLQEDAPASFEETAPDSGKENVQDIVPIRGSDVLIVDDDKDIREFIAGIISDRFDIMEASDGNEAVAMVAKRQPVLIISDVMMPGMDGVEFLRIMKSGPMTRHIPFILLSANNTLENQIEGLESGADAYLGKPFHPRHLLAMIDRLLGHGRELQDYQGSALAAVQQFEGSIVKTADKDMLVKVTDIVIRNMENESLDSETIASEVGVSKMQLYRKLKEIVGMTPTEYVRHIRLENAARLLRTTSRTVQEIMFNCGFSTKTWFYREFSKKYGMTPKEYRNANS